MRPPGLGKRHLLYNRPRIRKRSSRYLSPVIDKPGDLAGLPTNLQEDVLFIDEIHRIQKQLKNISIQQWRTTELTL